MPRREINAAEILLAAGITFVFAFLSVQMLVIPFTVTDLLIPSLILCLIWTLAFRYWKISLFVLGTVLFILLILWLAKRAETEALVSSFFTAYSDWIYAWKPDPIFDPLSAWLIAAAFSLPFLLLVRFRAPAVILLAIGTVLFCVTEFFGYTYPFILFWIYLTLIILMMAMQSELPGKYKTLRLLTVFPFCLAVVLIAAQIPAAKQGWAPGVLDWAHRHGLFVIDGEDTPVAPPAVGGEMGGAFNPSGTLMMRVKTDGSPAPYLRSSVGITYTGRSWLEEDGQAQTLPYEQMEADISPPYYPQAYTSFMYQTYPKAILPVLQPYQYFLSNISRLEHSSQTESFLPPSYTVESLINAGRFPLTPRQYTVTYENMRTDRFLLPADAIQLRMPETSLLYLYPGDRFSSDQSLDPATSYNVSVLDKTDVSKAFETLSDSESSLFNFPFSIDDGYKGACSALLENMDPYLQGRVEHEILLRYQREAEEIYKTYTALPDTLPQRVLDFAFQQFGNIGSEYDTAKAIEQYLSTTYPYNPDMPALPEGADFVDSFLFESKEGYCTYYASAMTVLCRVLGLPARYVEGFAPSSDFRGGEYYYSDETAHAWCETYFEGVGWVQFDPTAGYGIGIPEPTPPSATPSAPVTVSSAPVTPPSATAPAAVTPAPSSPSKSSLPVELLWTALFMLSIPLYQIGKRIFLFSLRHRKDRYLKSVSRVPYTKEQAQRIYKRILWLLALAKMKPRKTETLGDFAARVDESFPARDTTMQKVAQSFSKVCYGNEPLDEKESRAMLDFLLLTERRMPIYLDGLQRFIYCRVLHLFYTIE